MLFSEVPESPQSPNGMAVGAAGPGPDMVCARRVDCFHVAGYQGNVLRIWLVSVFRIVGQSSGLGEALSQKVGVALHKSNF